MVNASESVIGRSVVQIPLREKFFILLQCFLLVALNNSDFLPCIDRKEKKRKCKDYRREE